MPRADRRNPSGSCSHRTVARVAGRFASGSPIPMNTTLVTWSGAPVGQVFGADARRCAGAASATTTWRMTSPAVSWRRNPAWPVAQNGHPIAQPAWVEMHTVARFG